MSNTADSDEEMYSYKSSKTVYKRSRPTSAARTERETDRSAAKYIPEYKVYTSDDDVDRGAAEYAPVTKWAVDYNNKNYIRSQCNKNKGLHRNLKGRPQQYKIHYDNNHFTRSKVNAPKGLHRKIPETKRKYVPDNDELADATGWEFDYGPEFDQKEQDVHYIPEGRITRRGCYRWYGVKRNDSDCDLKLDEERENLLNEELEKELKYGQEFLQSDVPYLEEQKNRRYTRGGYRFYEVLRNVNDFQPEEFDEKTRDPEWKRKYHCNGVRYLDLEMCDCESDDDPQHSQHIKKGKPFRRTILNKVHQLKKEDSSTDVKRHATRISLIPGEGRQSLYEGIPDRVRYGTDQSPGIRSVYKKEREIFRRSKGEEYEEYEKEDTEKSYTELRSGYEGKLPKTADVMHGRRVSDEDLPRRDKGSQRFDEYTFRIKPEDDVRSRRRHSRNGRAAGVKEDRETWKENIPYKKEKDERGQHVIEKKSRGRRKEKIYEDRGYPSKDIDAERRNNEEEHYEYEEYRSQRRVSSSRSRRRHDNQIYEQTKINTAKDKTRDRDDIGAHLQHVSTRGKTIKDANNYKAKLTQDREQVSKKTPPRVDDRIKHTRDRLERKMGFADGKDKEQTLKKMPPHVEKRVRNIRGRMERNMEFADRKHKDRKDNGTFDHSSSDEFIDLMKHKGHPNDRGETHSSGYERYITKNGSEVWVKKNEKYAELHCKNQR